VKVVALYSIKGGVGKTTSAVNLSCEAARAGARVLLWDLDPQGAATFFFRVKPKVKGGADRLVGKRGELAGHVRESDVAGLHLLPADFSLRNLDLALDAAKHPTARLRRLLEAVAGDYDVVVLDCPPGISLSSEAVFASADALAVPTIPATLSARTITQLGSFLARNDDPPRVLPFVSMLDRRKSLHRAFLESIAGHEPSFLPTAIPNASVVERTSALRVPVAELAPRSAPALAYRSLWSDLATHLW
jgi:chromosome partitioning protein